MIFKFAKQPLNTGDDCCTPQPKGKAKCPLCANEAKGVLAKTLNALLKDDAKKKLFSLDGFSLCKTSTCKAVYFRGDEVLTLDDVSVSVGFKDGAKVKNYCYCFGWTEDRMIEDIKTNGKSTAIEDIQSKMKTIGCSCEVKNPSGKCCQGDVKKVLASLQ
ncbi:putative iron-sulfur cluster-binding metallochaperone [Sulfurospirillum sp. 1307]|jgi:bacterioferritin-associated ferredoxin